MLFNVQQRRDVCSRTDFEKTLRTLRARTWATSLASEKSSSAPPTSPFERPAQNSVFSYKYEATLRESAEILSEDGVFLLYSKSEQEHNVSGSALDEAQLASSSRPAGESDWYLCDGESFLLGPDQKFCCYFKIL